MPILATNPRAKFDYKILETYEAGIVLAGHEVKAVKNGRIVLKGAYVMMKSEEPYLVNAQIAPYQPKNTPADYAQNRDRKLLLRKKEIKELLGKIKQRNLTLVPLKAYTVHDRIKLEIGLGQGKKKADKREAIKKKEAKRRIERALRK